jgi:hypothetical protein
MHGEIDEAGGEGFFDFFREYSFAKSALSADLGQRNIGDLVAGGMNNFNFDFMSARAEQRGDVVGLPESKLRAAGADAEPGCHFMRHCVFFFAAEVEAAQLSSDSFLA